MAIDTVAERRALVGLVARGVVPIPDSSIDEIDRASLAGFFAEDVAAPEPDPAPQPEPGVTYTFSPPVQYSGIRVPAWSRGPERAFFSRASNMAVGRSVLKIDGTYVTIDTPTVDQINSATEYYAGGHIYTVDSLVAAALTAAGYGSGLS